MEFGFVRKGKGCLWVGEYGLLWTERSYLWARRVDLQAKRGLLYELGDGNNKNDREFKES